MPNIHPTAIVSKKAVIHDTVTIGPYAIVEDHVTIGAGTTVMASAYLTGYTTIGENNEIHMGAVVGHEPQDHAFERGIRSYVEIGNNNVIREYATIHRGTKPESKTVIGNNNFLMSGAHIAHNARIDNHVIIVNYSCIAGYAHIADRAFISGGVMVHQFVRIGKLVMMGGNSRTSKDIPPFMMCLGTNSVGAINIIGLRRAGVSKVAIREIKECYKLFYLSKKLKQHAIEELDACAFTSDEAREFIAFVRKSERPIAGLMASEAEE